MTAARLEEIRRDIDREAYTSYLPKTVRELLDYIGELQRGGAVVVPEYPENSFDVREAVLSAGGVADFDQGVFRAGWEFLASRIQPIPADRVLADGMVGVDREERDLLGRLHMVAMQFVMDADPAQRRSAAHLVQAVAALRQHEGRSEDAKPATTGCELALKW